MQTSDKGICALMLHEGIVPGPYKDSVGVMTYGIGHTSAAGSPIPADLPKGMPANINNELECVFTVFKRDLATYEAAVDRAITITVSQAEFDAAVSFHYNTGAIASATWVKTLNNGDRVNASKQIMNWKSPAEIIPRRQAEQTLFRDGVYPSGSITVWNVDSSCNVIWKPALSLSNAEALGILHSNEKPAERPIWPSRGEGSKAKVWGLIAWAAAAGGWSLVALLAFLYFIAEVC